MTRHRVSDTAPPKSNRPATKAGSILGVILFVYLALVVLPNVQSWGVYEFLAHTLGMAMLLACAGLGLIVGFCIGDQIDQLWSYYTKLFNNKDNLDCQPEPDNIVFDIDEHKKPRKVS